MELYRLVPRLENKTNDSFLTIIVFWISPFNDFPSHVQHHFSAHILYYNFSILLPPFLRPSRKLYTRTITLELIFDLQTD